MQLRTQFEIKNGKKLYEYLKNNSNYIKMLNRNSDNFKTFESDMKDKYKIRPTDKINDVIDNIDLVSNMLSAFKN